MSSGENHVGAETFNLVKGHEQPLFVSVQLDFHQMEMADAWPCKGISCFSQYPLSKALEWQGTSKWRMKQWICDPQAKGKVLEKLFYYWETCFSYNFKITLKESNTLIPCKLTLLYILLKPWPLAASDFSQYEFFLSLDLCKVSVNLWERMALAQQLSLYQHECR